MKITQAFVFILPTTPPEINAAVKPANASWNITNNSVGIVPLKSSSPIPLKKKLEGLPINPPSDGVPKAN